MNPVEWLWHFFDRQDFEAVFPLLHEDFILEWPQSRERIRGRENFIALNKNYPGIWRETITSMVSDADSIAAILEITDGKETVTCVGFYRLKEGKIWRAVEYWPQPYQAPPGREQWVEPLS